MSEEYEGEKFPVVRVVRHEIVDKRGTTLKTQDKEDIEEKLIEREAELVKMIVHDLDREKTLARDKFPDETHRIEGVKDHKELEALLEQLDEGYTPTKTKGRATLIQTQEIDDLNSAKDHAHLIHNLGKAQSRVRHTWDITTYPDQAKILSKGKRADKLQTKLLDGLVKNYTPETLALAFRNKIFWTCPVCGFLNEGAQRKNAGCGGCDYSIGHGKIIK